MFLVYEKNSSRKFLISDSSYWNSLLFDKNKKRFFSHILPQQSLKSCERNRICMEVGLVSRWYLTSVNFLIKKCCCVAFGPRVIWKGVGNEKRLDRGDSGGLGEGGLRPGGTWRPRPWIVELYIMCRDISTVGNLYRSYNILERTGREGGREGCFARGYRVSPFPISRTLQSCQSFPVPFVHTRVLPVTQCTVLYIWT